MKSPKIKIPEVDLKTFTLESLHIDPFWDDLIAEGDKSLRKSKRKRRVR